ncbi:uncharacterized protein LOC129587602 [Paramacrobiotus metropolitanus]|uniref:uncharacterized protein LOC129587602 n=1 Tax=Paramacrobiotus metropolitanus TaxID=2943436 RepID=UPI0024459D42|nr:uncharacterized protein LOC129587602 [Paramacrobiotus metropolitanus]
MKLSVKTRFDVGRNGVKALKVILILLGCLIIYFEWISYHLLPLSWPSTSMLETLYPALRVHTDRASKEQKVLRILLVADPQIQGFRDEPPGVLGVITRWDADRYLSKTYSLIYQHIDPHLVIFLGDLLDEGSTASERDYEVYADRFRRLFPLHGSKVLYVAGDNDIGGEGAEVVTSTNIDRFRKNFPTAVDGFWNTSLHLFEVNTLTNAVSNSIDVTSTPDHKLPRMLFSHMPLLRGYPDPFVEKVLNDFQPALIISAHTHKASMSQRSLSSTAYAQVTAGHRSDFAVFQLNPNPVNVQEIVVPTCSYRMGVAEIGYGVAIIDLTAYRLFYSVFWTPSRYGQLACELWALCAVAGFVLIFVVKQNYKLVYWKATKMFR